MRRQAGVLTRSGLVDFDEGDVGGRFGDWETVLREAVEVEGYGFPHIAFDLRWGRAGGYAAGEIGDVGGEVAGSGFDDEGVSFHGYQ